MIERTPSRFGGYILSCDECEIEAEDGFLNFSEIAQWAKSHSWYIGKEGHEWIHFCPHCASALGYAAPIPGDTAAPHETQSDTVERISKIKDPRKRRMAYDVEILKGSSRRNA